MKTKLVVYNESALGYISPERPDYFCVLKASPLRGAYFPETGLVPIAYNDEIRLAGPEDFDDFGVPFKGFEDRGSYEYRDTETVTEECPRCGRDRDFVKSSLTDDSYPEGSGESDLFECSICGWVQSII